jgi:hypothetical protein
LRFPEVRDVRRQKVRGAVERALLGAAMSTAAILANWLMMRRLARRRAQSK